MPETEFLEMCSLSTVMASELAQVLMFYG